MSPNTQPAQPLPKVVGNHSREGFDGYSIVWPDGTTIGLINEAGLSLEQYKGAAARLRNLIDKTRAHLAPAPADGKINMQQVNLSGALCALEGYTSENPDERLRTHYVANIRKAVEPFLRPAPVNTAQPAGSELRDAAQAVVERWDGPTWKDLPHTGEFIDRLRKALTQPVNTGPSAEAVVIARKIVSGLKVHPQTYKLWAQILAPELLRALEATAHLAAAPGVAKSAHEVLCDLLERDCWWGLPATRYDEAERPIEYGTEPLCFVPVKCIRDVLAKLSALTAPAQPDTLIREALEYAQPILKWYVEYSKVAGEKALKSVLDKVENGLAAAPGKREGGL